MALLFGAQIRVNDGAVSEAEGFCQRHLMAAWLSASSDVEAEADHLGGEVEFVLDFRVVGGEHLTGGLVPGAYVAGGTGEEEESDAAQDRVQDGIGECGPERILDFALGYGWGVRSLFRIRIGWISLKRRIYS
jgi:hypothetical protein